MAAQRLVFMGTPDFAVPSLAALTGAGHHIACVYTQPPRASGRGRRETPSKVHEAASARGIEVRCPETLKDDAVQDEFSAIGADAAVVVAYGLILPPRILAAPRLGCLNVHPSLLPRWRGAAPIQRALLAGDSETGVTIMAMDAGLDTGGVLCAEAIPITAAATAATLHDTLAALGAKMIVSVLDGLAAARLTPVPQPEAGVTYAKKIAGSEGWLDWGLPAAELERAVRALNPWPGTWFTHGNERIRVLAVEICDATVAPGAAPGTVLDDRLTVACKSGALRLVRLQRPGRSAMDGAAFLRGYPIPAATVFDAAEPDAPESVP